jgi:hypothetical protein
MLERRLEEHRRGWCRGRIPVPSATLAEGVYGDGLALDRDFPAVLVMTAQAGPGSSRGRALHDRGPQPGAAIAGEMTDVLGGDDYLITRRPIVAAQAARITSASRASGEAVGRPRWRASAQKIAV